MSAGATKVEAFDPARPVRDRRLVRFRPKSEVEDIDIGLARLSMNDTGNAERLVNRYGKDVLFVDRVGWHGWDERRWSLADGPRLAQMRAQQVAVDIHLEAAALFRVADAREKDEAAAEKPADGAEAKGAEGGAAPAARPRKAPKVLRKEALALRDWAVQSGNSARMAAMLREAAPHRTVAIDALDARPFLVNAGGGTIELDAEGGPAVRAPARDDLLTRTAPVAFDARAPRPHFDAFLATVQPDAEVRRFLQTFMGYALTGSTREQRILLMHGKGANGKSTFLDAMLHVFGDYGRTLGFESLLHDDRRRGGEAQPDLAELPGARLVVASEPESGARFSESRLKALSGGDRMVVRKLREAPFEFQPQFKLVLAFNNRPQVRGQDDGIWRRLLLVPWPVTLPAAKRDRALPEKLRAEAAGILAWLVEGARRWLDEGLQIPEAVADATNEYRLDQDPIGGFIADAVQEAAPTERVLATRLYHAYVGWAKQSAVEPISQTAFGRIMADRGFKKDRVGVVVYRGIKLLKEYKEQTEMGHGHDAGGGASEYPEGFES